MSNLPTPDDYRTPRAWRRVALGLFFFGVAVGAFVGALLYDMVVSG